MAERSDAPTVVVLNDTRVDRHHGCTAVMEALERGLAGAGFRIAALAPAHADWQADAAFVAAFDRADLVVVNGEGTIHHDRPAGARLLAAGPRARARGIRSALINCGWQANGPALAEAASAFDLVSARDSRSAAELAAGGVACRVVPDLSLLTRPPEPVPRRGIGFTDSVDRNVALRLEAARRRGDGEPVAIQHADRGVVPALRFHRAALAAGDVRAPRVAWSRLAARHRQWRRRIADPAAFLERLAGLQMLVSGRFHACTLALVADTPFVATASNTDKIRALVEDAGLDPRRADADPDDDATLRLRPWSADEAGRVDAYRRRAVRDAADLFGSLRELAR